VLLALGGDDFPGDAVERVTDGRSRDAEPIAIAR
jgi:hypothetical protein